METRSDIAPHQGRFIDGVHQFALRVYYEDTDFSGYVFHANYLRYIERARTDMLSLFGVDQRSAFDDGLGSYVVVEMQIRYLAPARYDDALTVESRLTMVHGATIVMDQRVRRGTESLFQADVRVAFIGPDGRPKRQPKEWTSAFASVMGDTAGALTEKDANA